jgi:hypothetical protein
MEYTYEIDEKNNVKISWNSGKCSQNNNPETLMPFTKEEAEAWAESAIEKIKGNNDTYSAHLFMKDISVEGDA